MPWAGSGIFHDAGGCGKGERDQQKNGGEAAHGKSPFDQAVVAPLNPLPVGIVARAFTIARFRAICFECVDVTPVSCHPN
jgi:hypothetical protein